MPERNHAVKQSVTVHEKSRKADPFNVHINVCFLLFCPAKFAHKR